MEGQNKSLKDIIFEEIQSNFSDPLIELLECYFFVRDSQIFKSQSEIFSYTPPIQKENQDMTSGYEKIIFRLKSI